MIIVNRNLVQITVYKSRWALQGGLFSFMNLVKGHAVLLVIIWATITFQLEQFDTDDCLEPVSVPLSLSLSLSPNTAQVGTEIK